MMTIVEAYQWAQGNRIRAHVTFKVGGGAVVEHERKYRSNHTSPKVAEVQVGTSEPLGLSRTSV